MPVYNCLSRFEGRKGGALLPQAINALQAQTHQDFELVVLDNGSKDGTLELLVDIARKDSRIHVVQDTRQRSSEEAIRVLIEQAPFELCVIVNDDDLWLPTFLEVLLRLHHEREVDLAYCNGRYLNMAGQAQTSLTRDDDATYSTRRSALANYSAFLMHRNPFPITFGIWRTEVLRRHYPTSRFDTYSADTDNLFLANVIRAGARIAYSDEELFGYRNRQRTFSAIRAFGPDAPGNDACWTFLRLLMHHIALASAMLREGRQIDESCAALSVQESALADRRVMASLIVHAQRTWFGVLAPRAVDRATHRALVGLYRLLFDAQFDRLQERPEIDAASCRQWASRLSRAADFSADQRLRRELQESSAQLGEQLAQLR